VLDEVLTFLRRPSTDVAWSTYPSQERAVRHIKSLRRRVAWGDPFAITQLVFLFMPTGALQEISLSSGWSAEFLLLSSRFDAASVRYANSLQPWLVSAAVCAIGYIIFVLIRPYL
jgi:hypothetical protein